MTCPGLLNWQQVRELTSFFLPSDRRNTRRPSKEKWHVTPTPLTDWFYPSWVSSGIQGGKRQLQRKDIAKDYAPSAWVANSDARRETKELGSSGSRGRRGPGSGPIVAQRFLHQLLVEENEAPPLQVGCHLGQRPRASGTEVTWEEPVGHVTWRFPGAWVHRRSWVRVASSGCWESKWGLVKWVPSPAACSAVCDFAGFVTALVKMLLRAGPFTSLSIGFILY